MFLAFSRTKALDGAEDITTNSQVSEKRAASKNFIKKTSHCSSPSLSKYIISLIGDG